LPILPQEYAAPRNIGQLPRPYDVITPASPVSISARLSSFAHQPSKIRLIVSEKIRTSRAALGARVGVEHDLDHAQETIVFDDKNRRHRLIPAHL
jgi:hypothetical protein